MSRHLGRIGLAFLFALPFGGLLLGAFAQEWRYPFLLPTSFTLSHWAQVFSNPDLFGTVLQSLALSTTVAAMSTAAGFLTARSLSRRPDRDRWLRLCYLPYGFSPVIYAYCMQYFYHRSGLAGQWAGVATAQLILAYPLCVLLFFKYFDSKIQAMEDLARTLGAGVPTVLRQVSLPLLRMPIRVIFYQIFLISWFDYGITSVIGLGQVKTLTMVVYQYIGESNIYFAALACCLIALLPAALWSVQQRLMQRLDNTVS